MEWRDEGVLLTARRFGERDAVVTLFTYEHGRHAGLVKGGTGRRRRPLLQVGNRLACSWRARLPEHLGLYSLEPLRLFAVTVLDDPSALSAVAAACGLIEAGLAERDPHPRLYAALLHLLERLAAREPDWPERYVRFELLLLEELGFGLDLGRCAVTGRSDELAYVSPKSGRAVCRDAAGPWAPRLLKLPAFLCGAGVAEPKDIVEGLRLTGFFLRRHLFDATGRGLPPAREHLLQLFRRQAAGAA